MKIPKLKNGDAVEVYWLDSHFMGDGWKSEEDITGKGEFTIRSVCIYIGKDKEYVHTVADRCETESGVMRDLKIPIGCIQSIAKLTKQKDKKIERS